MTDLIEKFNEAVAYVQGSSGKDSKLGNNEKLKFYALYKQASDGDVNGKKPGFTDFVKRAKYQAWEEIRGLSKEDAMNRYIELVDNIRA